MAFLPETGTGTVAGANSYVSVAEFKAYWDEVGFDYTIYSPDTLIERALVKATRYIDLRFQGRFRGCPLVTDPMQPLAFPRAYLYVNGVLSEGVPIELKRATFEYAKLALELPDGLAPAPAGYDATGQIVSELAVEVGPIKRRTKYEAGTALLLRPYPVADRMLWVLLNSTDGCIRN